MPVHQATRTKSIEEAAAVLGCSARVLYAHRQGATIRMGDGQELRLIRVGRRHRVADVELARFLGESYQPPMTELAVADEVAS